MEVLGTTIFFVALVFGFTLFTGTLTSGFHLIDDKDVYYFSDMIKQGSFWDTCKALLQLDIEVGRIRILYYPLRTIMTMLFDTNFTAWAIYKAIEIAGAMIFFYFFARNVRMSRLYSFLFASIAIVGEQGAVLWKQGTQENTGAFLVAIVLWLISIPQISARYQKIYRVNLVLWTILLSCIKESFALFLPVILGIIIWNELEMSQSKDWIGVKRAIGKHKKYILFTCILLLLQTIAILYVIIIQGTVFGNSGEGIKPKLLNMYFTVFAGSMTVYFSYTLIALLLLVAAYSFRQIARKMGWNIIIVGGIFLYATVMQLGLHMNTKLFERYLLPWTIAYAFCITIGIGTNFNQFRRKYIYALLLAGLLLNRWPIMVYKAQEFAQDGKALSLCLQDIIDHTQADSKIISMMPPIQMEWNFSMCTWLQHHDREETFLRNSSESEAYIREAEAYDLDKQLFTDYSDVDVIVTLEDGVEDMTEGIPVNWDNYRKNTYQGSYIYTVYIRSQP